MPKFQVILTRDVTESVCIEIEAADHDAATVKAIENVPDTGWELDENLPDDAYVTGVDEIDPPGGLSEAT
ncbi:hypothetical protein MHM88_14650 [Epibacterium sp. MM17-32]|uniref:hypothetical protein n=1 Tax=Epibacterium sp. MM17-32 TaxID=2917734 RepID=UPI001EF49C50|nr:hypothetical protein [Epibacterium sp. MM17-32]MCG7629048.1 hypothetical protein [Epibacterium sp. MM17-32]